MNILWPEGPTCPDCGSHDYTIMKDGRYRCKHCHKIYSPKSGTIFSHSHISLGNWCIALYLMISKKGLSSYDLADKISVTQKTAYFMMMKLRFLFNQDDIILGDEIACDEEFIGGQWGRLSLHKRQELLRAYKLPQNPQNQKEKMSIAQTVNNLYKQPVFGMNDGTKLILRAMPNGFIQDDIVQIFNQHSQSTGNAVADCSMLYDNWNLLTGYNMSRNNHSKAQFVAADGRSSNRIEGSFSNWKRNALFNYVHLSKRLCQLYLDEFCFRWNTRCLTIIEKLATALTKCHQIINKSILAAYNSIDIFPIRQIKIFDPYEFFRNTPFIDSVVRGGVVYRRAEFCHQISYCQYIIRPGSQVLVYTRMCVY